MIKIKQGLLLSCSKIWTSGTPQYFNKYNLFKGSEWRMPTIKEARIAATTDLNGNTRPYTIFDSVRGTGNLAGGYIPVQEIQYVTCDNINNSFTVSDLDGFYSFTKEHYALYEGYIPAYEYIDNSKSTNIFY